MCCLELHTVNNQIDRYAVIVVLRVEAITKKPEKNSGLFFVILPLSVRKLESQQ